MATKITIRLSVGRPFATGEECPICLFDSMVTVLYFVGSSPGFKTACGRTVCRDDRP